MFDLNPGQIEIPEELEHEFPTYDSQIAINFFERIIRYDPSLAKNPGFLDNIVKTAEIWSSSIEDYEYFLPNTADLLYGLSEFYKIQKPVNKLPFILAETNFNPITSSKHPDGYSVIEFDRSDHRVNGLRINIVDFSARPDNVIGFPFIRPS